MKTLTSKQAALLREMRKPLRLAIAVIVDHRNDLVSACEHLESPDPECPLCELYYRLNEACGELEELPDVMDKFLENGPDPRAKKEVSQ